jgi:hypothetical protein
MPPRNHPTKTTLAIALAIAGVAPSVASARPLEGGPPPATPSPRSTAHVVTVPAPSGFDWGDAGIGAAAGIGLSALTIGGSLVLVGKRRNRPHAPAGSYAPAR